MLRKNARTKHANKFKYTIQGNLDNCERHVDSVVSRMQMEMKDIPRWLVTVRKRFDDVINGNGNLSVISELSVFEMTQSECIPTLKIDKSDSPIKKKLSLICEEDEPFENGLSDSHDSTTADSLMVEFIPKMLAVDRSPHFLPKPTTKLVEAGDERKNENNFLLKVTETKTPLKSAHSPRKNKLTKINEKSKRTFAQMSKASDNNKISSLTSNAQNNSSNIPIKITAVGESSFREKLAKCEMMQHQKKAQVKAKQEEMKSKTMSRIMANKERRMRAEEERLQKYKYEELRKQVAREKIAELNKNTKSMKTRQLTPIKFKTHGDTNPTAIYHKKDTSQLCIIPEKKRDQRSQFQKLETIPDLSVETDCDVSSQFNQQPGGDMVNYILTGLDDVGSLIKENDQNGVFAEKLTAISSTPFNNAQNHKRSLNNIDATFNESHSYVPPPQINLVIENALNFSSTLPNVDNSHITDDQNNDTFVIEKENSRKNSSTCVPQYEMTIIDSQATSDDDDNYYVQCSDSTKPIPDWARSENIWESISKQITEKKLVADNIFGPIPRVNMNDIFKSTNRDLGNRNNSSIFNDSSADIN